MKPVTIDFLAKGVTVNQEKSIVFPRKILYGVDFDNGFQLTEWSSESRTSSSSVIITTTATAAAAAAAATNRHHQLPSAVCCSCPPLFRLLTVLLLFAAFPCSPLSRPRM
jgi:hypothetical protein